MSTSPYEVGEWYVVITCHACKSRQPVIHDLTRGKANINVIYTWECSQCGYKGVYEGEAIELYLHVLANSANG